MSAPDPKSATLPRHPARVALLIDGDNLSPIHAGTLISTAARHGALIVKRVYGNMAKLPGWNDAPGFKCVHAGSGKNAADLLLAVEAMALILSHQADTLIIASSDGDFSHLAQHLVERGHNVIGMGLAKSPAHFRKSCTSFHELAPIAPAKPAPPPDPLIPPVRALLRDEPMGLAVSILSSRMSQTNAARISQTPHKTWRAFLTAHPALFDLDPKGPDARVRLRA